ncbi:MAG: hypothetical protein E6Q88_14530 [Lysobacteraceae bacterium]|nr:MAG: hypothetical protein E6Q88_14530 [Xanthomonadaceae bacterium]
MSFTVQFLQQQPAVATTDVGAPATCGLHRIGRSARTPRRAMRIHACAPPPKTPAAVAPIAISAHVPQPGHSVLHQRIHAGNVAAIGKMLALQQQAIEQTQQTLILRQQTDAQLKIALATEVIAKHGSNRPDPGKFEPELNDLKYSIIAEIIAATAHLVDKHDVDADSYLHDKLMHNTLPLIGEVRGLLAEYKLEAALRTFDSAVDTAVFEKFVGNGELTSRAVYDEINRRAGLLLATMLLVAAEDFGDGIDPGDWPAASYDEDGGIQTTPAPGDMPAQPPSAATATPKAARRAVKKNQPRSKR